jgi:hypothetical protein
MWNGPCRSTPSAAKAALPGSIARAGLRCREVRTRGVQAGGVIDDSTKISISKRILLGVEPSGAAALEGALKLILRRL